MTKNQMNNRLNAMFNTVLDGVITINKDGKIDSFNPAAENLFGYQSSEVVGENVSILMAEPHRSQHDQYIQNYLETNKTQIIGKSRELMGRCKDGSLFPFILSVSEMIVDDVIMFTGVVHDLSDLSMQRHLLNAITEAQSSLSSRHSPKIIFDKLLEQLLQLTVSEYGFIGEVLLNNDSIPYLKTHAITDISWNEETKKFYQEGAPDGLEFRNLKTLFGHVIVNKEIVISNDPQHDKRSGGLPEGHPPLNSFLGLPFYDGNELIGMVGIANRIGGYSEEIVTMLHPFLITCGSLLLTLKSEQQRQDYETSLRESEARGRAILEGATEAIITINDEGIIEDVNPATEIIFGYKPEEIFGKNVKLLMPEPYSYQHDGYLKNYLTTGQAKVIGSGREVIGKRKDGSTFPMELAVNHITVGGRDLFTGVIRDITELKINEEQLNALNSDLSQKLNLLAQMNKVNSLLNEMGSFFQLSESIPEINKVLRKYCIKLFDQEVGAYYSAVGKNLLEQVIDWGEPKSEQDFYNSHCWALRKGELYEVTNPKEQMLCNHLEKAHQHDGLNYSLCAPVIGRDGAIGLLSIYGRNLSDKQSNQIMDDPLYQQESDRFDRNKQILRDVAERFGTAVSNIKLRQKLHQESTVDPLTKLYNRRFFEEASELELRRTKRNKKSLSILMLDADFFKSFNDEYGHDAGDYVLCTIANVLKDHCRREDIPTRLGGEEFAILFSMSSSQNACNKAEIIRNAIEKTQLKFEDKSLRKITISCGISSIPDNADSISECLTQADKALYKAKESGRNRVVCFNDNDI
jgi:diguanylate cyclase (GGDEF)-like protein/PAS domain S-box-containing protein